MEKAQCKCLSKCAPPVCVAYGSNISPNVFLIKAAAAVCMNMIRIHRQITPPPPQHGHNRLYAWTLKHM